MTDANNVTAAVDELPDDDCRRALRILADWVPDVAAEAVMHVRGDTR